MVCTGTLHSHRIVASCSVGNRIPLWDWGENVYKNFSSNSLKSTSSLL